MALPSISGGGLATMAGESTDYANIGSNAIANGTDGWLDCLTPKASEIFEKRTATRIFDSHQDIALKSIEGSQFPKFDENQNLYGFTIFQFKSGILGGGWAEVNVNTLLGFDVTSAASSMLGGDKVANVQSYFFNMHPRNINVSEPFATHLIPTQGGGVYSESQGSILKQITMSGTTGYRPSKVHTVTADVNNVIPHEVDEPTGYLNFLKLRNLFRNYSDLKKTKSLAYKTYLIWYNNKEQEAWFFEPSEFTTVRDSASPLTYDYNISGTLIQKVNFSTIVNTLHPDPNSPHFWAASMRRSATFLNGFLNKIPGVGDDAIGDALALASTYLQYVDTLENFVVSMTMTGMGILAIPLLLAGAIGAVGQELISKFDSIFGDESKYSDLFGPSSNLGEALGDGGIWQQMIQFDYHVNQIGKAANKILSPEGVAQLKDIASVSAGRLAQDAKGTISGSKNYLSDADHDWTGIPVPSTSIDFESWVAEQTGDPGAFAAVVLYNNLQYPYVTQTPSYQSGFDRFLNPGDLIYLPMEKEYVEGDINTVINPAKIKLNTFAEILGRDLRLIKKSEATTGVSEFNLSISPDGDLEIVAGKDNIKQAIDIKLNTERGELGIHPGFGIVPVVGHKGTNNTTFNLFLSLHDTMLGDGRIKELTNTLVNISGDKASVKTNVHVIGHIPYIPLVFTMG